MIIISGKWIVAAAMAVCFVMPLSADAATLKAYNISQDGCECYQEGYLDKQAWEEEYDAKIDHLAELESETRWLDPYVDQDWSIDWDSLIYISDVQKKIDEITAIRDAAQEKSQEAALARSRSINSGNSVSNSGSNGSYNVNSVATNNYNNSNYTASGSGDFKNQGVVYSNGTRYTYYSSNVAYHYRTPEWTAGTDGMYRDSDGYIVVASSDQSQGSVVSTPFGAGKVYDSGCASGTIDIYTNF